MRTRQFMTKAVAPFTRIASPYRRAYALSITKWVTESGFDWTAARVKSLVQYALKLRSGDSVPRPPWVASVWLKYLEKISLQGNDQQFIELIQVLRAYTMCGREKVSPSPQDEAKFLDAVTELPSSDFIRLGGPLVWELGVPKVKFEKSKFFLGMSTSHPCAIREDKVTRVLRQEAESLITGRGVVPVPNLMALTGPAFENMVGNISILQKISNKLGFSKYNIGSPYHTLPFQLRQVPLMYISVPPESEEYAGTVYSRVQSDGKVRYFYSPPVWMQFLLRPWAKKLFRALKGIKEDCTFDQEKGVEACTKWLSEGRKVWSFDLSSATDRFPLCVSTSFLSEAYRNNNWQSWVRTFLICSQMPVRFRSIDGTVSSIVWRCGQPLGTIASFPVFALTHHWIIRSLARIFRRPLEYRILGDDIIIADYGLAGLYQETMEKLGVGISLEKSIASPRVGEFAGRVIGPEAFGFKLKYPEPTLRSLPAMIDLVGPKALRWLPQSHLRDVIALLPIGRSPGYNPGGYPKDKVDQFIKEYYALEPDPDYKLPPAVVGTRKQTEVKASVLPEFAWDPPDDRNLEPRGSLDVDEWGAPITLGHMPDVIWKRSPFMSRRWLTRVRKAARTCGLL